MQNAPVVVIGTTPDYVSRISTRYLQPCLFIVDSVFKQDHVLEHKDIDRILFAPMEDENETLQLLEPYLRTNHISPKAVACFDCERLLLAGRTALHLNLPFPSLEAIALSRNKFESMQIWRNEGIRTHRSTLADDLQETMAFFHRVGKDIVLKPISGSGSELVFRCGSPKEIRKNVRILKKELLKRASHPLFRSIPKTTCSPSFDPCKSWVAEEFISGPEFSCDFFLSHGCLTVIRETGKIRAQDQPFGSVLAYTFPPAYPDGFSLATLGEVLQRATRSLGFEWGYFMADFIIHENYPFLIEMAPRPGGDSIPDLVEMATGQDVIGIYLDIMCGKGPPPRIRAPLHNALMSVNLFADKEGVIIQMDTSEIESKPWVRALHLKKRVGDRITLPPKDYDSRLLAYAIISNEPPRNPYQVQSVQQDFLQICIADRGK